MIDYDYMINHLLEIITIIAVFVIFVLQLRKKTLTYTVLTNSGVIPGPEEAKSPVQIRYKGKVVPKVRLVEIRIKNSGSLPIKRSEEHTSELQSQSNLVCRLLLEKKK